MTIAAPTPYFREIKPSPGDFFVFRLWSIFVPAGCTAKHFEGAVLNVPVRGGGYRRVCLTRLRRSTKAGYTYDFMDSEPDPREIVVITTGGTIGANAYDNPDNPPELCTFSFSEDPVRDYVLDKRKHARDKTLVLSLPPCDSKQMGKSYRGVPARNRSPVFELSDYSDTWNRHSRGNGQIHAGDVCQ